MPRKSKKSTEPEAAAALEAESKTSGDSPIASGATRAAESDLPRKSPRKRAAKSSSAAVSETRSATEAAKPMADSTGAADVEAAAQAADTFEDAFESNDAHETRLPAAAKSEPEKPKKSRRTKSIEARAEKAETKPQPEPDEEREAEIGPDEDAELEGDWESGSGSEGDEDEEQTPPRAAAKLERLQKILAAAGVASRRHAEDLISEGRVQVNGKVVTELGSKADAARDHIRVDGKLIHGAERLRYFVLNKPRGYVTTVSDPEGRPTVMQFFSKMGERLYPVGRLDYQSEGLLLMTNDGELANKLTRAASGVEKTYLVKVSGQPDEELIEDLREGVRIDRGRPGEGRVRTAPARIHQVRGGENPWFEVALIEGRNRELRKMFEEIGHHVEKIRRVGYGPLVLDLEPGQMRELEPEELNLLRLAAEGKWKPKRLKTATMLPKEAGRSVDHEARMERGGRSFGGDRRPKGGGGFGPREDRRGGRPFTGPRRQDSGERPAYRAERPAFGGDRERRQDRGGFRRDGAPRFGQQGGRPGAGGQQREGFGRPQGNRPFRGRPEFDTERPRGQGRPAGRPGLRIEEEGRESRSGEERAGNFGRGEGRGGGGRREEQGFGNRPARRTGGGFRPQREGQERRGGSRGFAGRERFEGGGKGRDFGARDGGGGEFRGQARGQSRGPGRGFGSGQRFGQGTRRTSGRAEGGESQDQRPPRTGFGDRSRGGERRGEGGGGKSRFGSNRGGRPGARGGNGQNRSGGRGGRGGDSRGRR